MKELKNYQLLFWVTQPGGPSLSKMLLYHSFLLTPDDFA